MATTLSPAKRRAALATFGPALAVGVGLLLGLSLAGWWLSASRVLGLCAAGNLLLLAFLLTRRPAAARPARRGPTPAAPLRVNPFFDLLSGSSGPE